MHRTEPSRRNLTRTWCNALLIGSDKAVTNGKWPHVFAFLGASGLSKSSRACNLNSGVLILSFVGARSVELWPFYSFFMTVFANFWISGGRFSKINC